MRFITDNDACLLCVITYHISIPFCGESHDEQRRLLAHCVIYHLLGCACRQFHHRTIRDQVKGEPSTETCRLRRRSSFTSTNASSQVSPPLPSPDHEESLTAEMIR